jgi:two-component system phosphate regulon sensor histidine kinase PhoR
MAALALTAILAGLPVFLLALLAVVGWANAWAALTAGLLIVLAAAGFVAVWSRDVDLLTERLRLIGGDPPEPLPADSLGPTLLEPLGRETERLARRLANRSALMERHRRADTLILEQLPDPLIVLSADHSVRRSNAAARAAFGSDMAAVLRHPGLRAAIDRAMGQAATQMAELSLPVPVPRELHATVVPLDPPLADGGQAVVVLSDRTRERAVERMRADFVANVSHELRTPLASLIGFTETLRGPAADDPPAQQRFLAIMAEQGARMNRLIDDLLSLSRIELNEHQPPSESVQLTELVPRLAAGLEPRFAERKVRLAMDMDADLPPITGDADQIAQVLQNLLDNAVKYGFEAGTVTLILRRAEGAPRWPARPGVEISVTDQGAGIPPEHLPRLTERFYRVDKGRSRAAGGTGLGLAIVKHIVNRHRGQLSIESQMGVGTTVSVWLPLSQPAARPDERTVSNRS